MSIVVLRIAAALYLAAAAAYILYFARPRHVRAAKMGFGLVLSAFLLFYLFRFVRAALKTL